MKKLSLLIVASLLTSAAVAQEATFGLKGGLNLSTFSASVNAESTSSRAGLNIGLYFKAPIGGNAFFRTELYYSAQGQISDWGGGDKTTAKLDYINVPFMIEVGNKVSFQGGLQPAILISAREEGTLNGSGYDEDMKDLFRSADLSLVLGIGFAPSDQFNAGLRYNLGLLDTFKADEDANISGLDFPDIKNRVFHIYVGFAF
jgi:hypothetical protein